MIEKVYDPMNVLVSEDERIAKAGITCITAVWSSPRCFWVGAKAVNKYNACSNVNAVQLSGVRTYSMPDCRA